MVSGSALQLETCYDVVALSYLLSTKTYLSAKLAASSVAAEPCSNNSPPVAENISSCEWYSGIIQFLQKLEVPPGLTLNQARSLKLKSAKFCIVDKLLYWKYLSGVLLRCLDKEESA